MAAPHHLTYWSALRTLIARVGLYWIAVGFLTFAYWQLTPGNDSWWIFPALLMAGTWMTAQGLKDRADKKAAERLAAGQPPVAGQWSAVAGIAVPDDPEAKDEILACRFQLRERDPVTDSRRSSLRLRYDGFYLVPTAIDTGSERIPVFGFPDLSTTPEDKMPEDMLARAEAAARQAPTLLLPPIARELAIAGPITDIEDCIAYGSDKRGESRKIESWFLKTGDEVCVFGLWKNGALHASYRRADGLPVYEGRIDKVLARLSEDSFWYSIFGGILLAAAFGVALWGIL